MRETNRQWLLKARPQNHVQATDFDYREVPVERTALAPGEFRLRNVAFICAPTMRNWMDPPGNSLYPSIPLDTPVMAPAVGEVIDSAVPELPVGARVFTLSAWQDYSTIDTARQGMPTLLPDDIGLIDGLGRYGMNPLTAYFGLLEVGQPRAGETLVVSGAAGSTGSTAAQIGRIQGMRVIGIAGGPEKCAWLTGDCRLDAAIDYKHEDVEARLAELCPKGIDVYFDNVGGTILQAVINNIAPFGRIVLCGQIASYDSAESPEGPRNMMRLVYGSVRMEGFLVSNYADRYHEGMAQLQSWHEAGEIAYREDLAVGFDRLPTHFMKLFEGANEGTLLVQIDDGAGATG